MIPIAINSFVDYNDNQRIILIIKNLEYINKKTFSAYYSSIIQKTMFYNIKGHLLQAKRYPFTMRKATNGKHTD